MKKLKKNEKKNKKIIKREIKEIKKEIIKLHPLDQLHIRRHQGLRHLQ